MSMLLIISFLLSAFIASGNDDDTLSCADQVECAGKRGSVMLQTHAGAPRAPKRAPRAAGLTRGAAHGATHGGVVDSERAPSSIRRTRSTTMTYDHMASLLTRAKTMRQQATSVQVMLRRAMNTIVQPSGDVSTGGATSTGYSAVNGVDADQVGFTNADPDTIVPDTQLDKLIFNFVTSNEDSQDECPAKLLEAKHQLNQLHKHMYSVAYDINTTSKEVIEYSTEVESLNAEWKGVKGKCKDDLEKCEKEDEYYKKQWEILKWELIEMKQIADPSVTILPSDMSYAAYVSRDKSHSESKSNYSEQYNYSSEEWWNPPDGKGAVPEYAGPGDAPEWWPTLFQAKADRAPPGLSVTQAVSSMVKQTKSNAEELKHCFAHFAQPGQPTTRSEGDEKKGPDDKGNYKGSYTEWDKNTTPLSGGGSSQEDDLGGSGWRNSSAEHSLKYKKETWSGSFVNNSKGDEISEECKLQLQAFSKTYYKAYKQVVRLISEYEKLVNNTECEDNVDEDCKAQDAEFSIKSQRVVTKLGELTEHMTRVKGHISVTSNQEARLTQHIKELSQACTLLDETISDLDKVRDAIQIFGVCAGLGRPNFHIPQYGAIIKFEIDSESEGDEDIDMAMQKACLGFQTDGTWDLTGRPADWKPPANYSARAAETAEIMQAAIDGMPTHNKDLVLFGTCPHCAGKKDDRDEPHQHKSGHYRTCWNAKELLDGSTMRSNCGHSEQKAVMCVFDRYDLVVEETGLINTTISGSSESTSGSIEYGEGPLSSSGKTVSHTSSTSKSGSGTSSFGAEK